MISRLLTGAFACMMMASVQADTNSLVEGDIEAGKAKSVTCAACHGAEGQSINPQWPNLAGQHAKYLVDQLQAFKDGERNNVLMNSQAMMLSDQDMKNIAVYFEAFPKISQTIADENLLARGEALYRGGNKENRAAACIACHGPKGDGNAAAGYPVVAGQHAVYTAQTLRDYASGARKSGGEAQVMQEIAQSLSEDDIVAVASYIQGLQ